MKGHQWIEIEGQGEGKLPILGYARVSSEEQREDSHALDQQIDRLIAAGCDRICVDVVSAYQSVSRPGLDEVMGLVESGACDRLIVTRLDRMSRRGLKGLELLERFMAPNSPGLQVLDEPVDLTTAAGKLMAGQLFLFAEFHSGQKAESVKHGWRALRQRQQAISPPFGYCLQSDQSRINRYTLDHTEFVSTIADQRTWSKAEIAERLIQEFLSRRSLRKACRWINEEFGVLKNHRARRGMLGFSSAGLHGWLLHPVLRGHTCYRAQTVKRAKGDRDRDGSTRATNLTKWAIASHNTHPALISQTTYESILKILQEGRATRGYGSTALKYPLSGLVRCAACGGACYSISGSSNYYRAKRLGVPVRRNLYFQCSHYTDGRCANGKMIRMELVEEAAIAALTSRAGDIARDEQTPETQTDPELERLQAELIYYQSAPGNRAYEIIGELESAIQAKLIHKDQQELNRLDMIQAMNAFRHKDFWRSCEPEIKREAFRKYIKKITIRNGEVISIEFNI